MKTTATCAREPGHPLARRRLARSCLATNSNVQPAASRPRSLQALVRQGGRQGDPHWPPRHHSERSPPSQGGRAPKYHGEPHLHTRCVRSTQLSNIPIRKGRLVFLPEEEEVTIQREIWQLPSGWASGRNHIQPFTPRPAWRCN